MTDSFESLREKVAQCCRMMEHLGLVDFSGHVSARIPGDKLLINSYGAERCKVTAKDIVTVDFDGNVLEDGARAPSEVAIHIGIYRKRPDVNAVAHLHAPITTALSVTGKELFPVIYQGSILKDGIAIYDDARHVNTEERGRMLAEALGPAKVVLIRGHGSVVATESIESCFFTSVYCENNSRTLFQGYQVGEKVIPLRTEELEEGSRDLWKASLFKKVWDYFFAKTDPI